MCRNPENPLCLVRTQPRLGHSLGHFCPLAETLLVSKARTLLPVYFHSKMSPAGMEALPGQGNQRRQRRGQDSALGCVWEFAFHLVTSALLARRRARAVADGVPGGRLSGGPRCTAPRRPLCFAKGQSFTQCLSYSMWGAAFWVSSTCISVTFYCTSREVAEKHDAEWGAGLDGPVPSERRLIAFPDE